MALEKIKLTFSFSEVIVSTYSYYIDLPNGSFGYVLGKWIYGI